jgi:hypothetical protein
VLVNAGALRHNEKSCAKRSFARIRYHKRVGDDVRVGSFQFLSRVDHDAESPEGFL